MKRNWLSVIVIIAVALSVWGGLPAQRAQAATCTWTGAISTAWEVTGNWASCQGTGDAPPANNDSVIIPVAINNPVISTAATTGLNVTIQNGGQLTNNSSGAISFASFTVDNGGKYIHNRVAALPGTTRSFGATSTIEFLRNTANTCPVAAAYGNLVINISNFTGNVGCGANLVSIAGNLEIKNTTGFQLRLVSTQTTAHAIGGSLIISGGTLALSSGAGNPVVTVSGNISITSGTIDLGTSTGAPTLIVNGNLDQSGGSLLRSGSNSRTINLAGNWIRSGGIFTSTGISVNFNGTTEQTIGGLSATSFTTLTVASGAKVVLPVNATATSLTNNGTITQTQTVPASGSISFASTGGYGGVAIDGNGTALGTTEVAIKNAAGTTCTTGGQAVVDRCFQITPGNGSSGYNATVTFSFSTADLNGEDCNSLLVYHYDGSGVWTPLTEGASHTYTRQCTTSPYSVQVTGVTTFSPFVLADNISAPNAVTLSDFSASTSAASPAPFVFGVLGLFAAALLLRRRATRTTSN